MSARRGFALALVGPLSPGRGFALAAGFVLAGCKAADPSAGASAGAASESAPGATAQPSLPRTAGERPRLPRLAADPRAADDGERGGEGRRRQREEMKELYDSDGDGHLSDDERAVMREARLAGVVDRLDLDRDGKLTAAELAAAPEPGHRGDRRPPWDFAALDTDKDGFVTVEEMAAGRPPRRPGRPGTADRGGAGAPPPL